MENNFNTGGLLDLRSDKEQSRDFKHEEIVASAAPVDWKKKTFEELRKFPQRFQEQSFSCMAQSGSKNLGISNTLVGDFQFKIVSALPVYRSRSNYPSGGMSLPDLFKALTSPLACFEEDLTSQYLSEPQMNAYNGFMSNKEVSDAKLLKADSYFYFSTPINIDEIAAVLATGKGVQLMLFFNNLEYWKPVPEILDPNLDLYAVTTARHGVAAVDYLLMPDGQKALYIEDSAGNQTGINGEGRRYLTEKFLQARCFGAGYLVKKAVAETPKPKYNFTRALTYGMRNDVDVKALQTILQYEGLFPKEVDGVAFPPTGNFLGMTADSLKKWQIVHGLNDFAGEMDMRKIRFGAKSIAIANKLYF